MSRSIIRARTRMRIASCSASKASTCRCGSRSIRRSDARRSSAPAMAATRCAEMRGDPFRPAAWRGFTMIEVLVALAIIAVALAASLRAVGSLATGEADLHRRLLAGWGAGNALAQLRLPAALAEGGPQRFACSPGYLPRILTQRGHAAPRAHFPPR